MRLRLVQSGVLVLIVGLALLVVGASIQTRTYKIVATTTNSWQVTANLTQNNYYYASAAGSEEWGEAWAGGGYTEPQPALLEITSPNGNVTIIRAYFESSDPTEAHRSPRPVLVDAYFESVDNSSLDVDTSYAPSFGEPSPIRFKVLQGGIFTCRMDENLTWTAGAPGQMMFYLEIVENKVAYLIPGGGAVCIGGVVVAMIGSRSSERSAARNRKTRPRK